MLYMIFGGSGSGKSAYAEDLAVKLCPEEKVYLATLTDIDEEMERRIQDHRRMREGKNFRTVEQGLSLETLDLSGERLVLLECMTNLLANELYSHEAKHPEMARQHDIEQRDERNVAIRNRAKAVSGEALQWAVLAAAWLSIGLDAPLWVPLAATGVFVAKSVLELYLMVRYEREM